MAGVKSMNGGLGWCFTYYRYKKHVRILGTNVHPDALEFIGVLLKGEK